MARLRINNRLQIEALLNSGYTPARVARELGRNLDV